MGRVPAAGVADAQVLQMQLRGRTSECAALDAHLEAARAGDSRAIVLRGEAGIGKTALLDYVAERSQGCRVIRAVGIESEMELPFAAVHQLSQPLLDGLERLPPPQREALETAFGLSSGQPPDRFFVGLALLSQLSEFRRRAAAGLPRRRRPVAGPILRPGALLRCPAPSRGVGRHRLAERDGDAVSEFEGLPELRLRGLSEEDAAELVTSATLGPVDKSVRGRILAEARGNPLALLELSRGDRPARRSGLLFRAGYPCPAGSRRSYRRRIEILAERIRDVCCCWQRPTRWAIPTCSGGRPRARVVPPARPRLPRRKGCSRSTHASDSGTRFCARRSTRRRRRRSAAASTEHWPQSPIPRSTPTAVPGIAPRPCSRPDDAVAAELEQSAGRAQARGGLAAAAAFLQRSVALTQEPARRADRALAAAQASLEAGAFDVALALVAAAESRPLDDLGSSPRRSVAGRGRVCPGPR